ncbi:calcineurin B-like protein 10 isoform X1 [Bidens hawaiensis]|uniref:calcineurin B-like protein 10 isoform X1 n=1 Tax=Bidens hawaiensis TaxID=980011 RepID=UPI00404A7EC5
MGAASSSSSSSTSRSSSLTVGEKLCAALIPCVVAVELLIHCLSPCLDANDKRPVKPVHTFDEVRRLARNSPFSVNEVEALRELFNKFSCSIIDDGLIHKEELQLALLNSAGGENLFLNKVFDLFDEKQNGVIEFEEFVHVLSIFHPNASIELKIDYAFKFYDLRKTGYIEREEVQEMIVAALKETGMHLSDDVLQQIIDNTFADADADMDGRINQEEWRNFVIHRPHLLKNMTLPSLRDVTAAFPSFIFNTGVDDV